jgi:hypothetical protein
MEPPTPGPFGAVVDAKRAELDHFREDLLAVGTLGSIGHVVRGLRELPGRKSVLVISDGFRIFDDDNPARANRVALRLRRLVDEAARASVVIHTMNASGLQRISLAAEDSLADGGNPSGARTPNKMAEIMPGRSNAIFVAQSGLSLLAESTGGVAVRNNNDLNAGIRQALDDQKGYYLIGFRPDASTFDPKTGGGLFHRLSLKITRPGKFDVRMRKGFLGAPDAEAAPSPRTPQGQINSALLSPFGADGVRVQLTSLFANDAEHGSFTRSLLYVDANDLTFTEEPDGWRKATFDVVAVTFDESGNVVDQLSRTDALRLRGEGYRQVLERGFVYHLVFPVKKPGAYQLRAALRDHDSERVGSAGQFVEIPDLKRGRLALSGLVVSASASGTQAAGAGESETRQADPQAGEAVRRFKQGALVRYSFVIYNARLDKVARAPRLEVQVRLFRGGQPVFTGKVQPFTLNNPPDLSRLAAGGAVTLGADMQPGEYVLQVTVNDLLADEKHRIATQWMDFELVK